MSHAELAQDVMSHPLPTVIEIALLGDIALRKPNAMTLGRVGVRRERSRLSAMVAGKRSDLGAHQRLRLANSSG